MKIFPFREVSVNEVKKFVVVFYIVGVLGFLLPFSKNLFVAIIPFALLLNMYLLAVCHARFVLREVLAFTLIYFLGFGVEVLGVKTGYVFGNYHYGNGLGFKFFETPLIIGLNWLFVTYSAVSICEEITQKIPIQLLIAPSLMLFYDILLEQLAPFMDMWYWSSKVVPIKNYVAWWFIGLIFVVIIKLFKVSARNPLGALLYVCQLVFFILIYVVFKFLR